MSAPSYPLLDCHTHLGRQDPQAGTRLLARAAQAGIRQCAVMVVDGLTWPNRNPAGLLAKRAHPDRIFLFAALDYAALAHDLPSQLTLTLGRQVQRLWALGADGLKLLTGKPNVRQASGIALDSPVYEPAFAALEELGVPLLWHVNDPEEFWDPDQAPEWAKAPGWIYDARFPTNESLYQECERVLARHPRLRVIFAHFYFLSADLPRAAALFDRYPGVHLDLAPGIEMFHNFSARLAEAREFFHHYRDRILFGTDLVEDSPLSRVEVIRRSLETADTFHVPTDEPLFWPDQRTTLHGLALPPEVLAPIYAGNFQRLVGAQPRPLDLDLLQAELDRIAAVDVALGRSPDQGEAARDPGL